MLASLARLSSPATASKARQKTPLAAFSAACADLCRQPPSDTRLAELFSVIAKEKNEHSGVLGPCLEHFLRENILAKLVVEAAASDESTSVLTSAVAKAVGQMGAEWLVHSQVHKPIIQLISGPSVDDRSKALLLSSVVTQLVVLPSLLLVFCPVTPAVSEGIALVTVLLRYVHLPATAGGNLARRTLVNLFSLCGQLVSSASQEDKARRDAATALLLRVQERRTPDVLFAACAALFSSLPQKLRIEGSTTRSRKRRRTDDWGEEEEAGRMILGGMGPLEDDDEEGDGTAEDEEEDRWASMGFGLAWDPAVQETLATWLATVEMAQDIVSALASPSSDRDDPRAPLRESILKAFKSQVLEGAIYRAFSTAYRPYRALVSQSHEEIEDEDEEGGSSAGIVALLHYLEKLLGVLSDKGELGEAVLKFLMATEDASGGEPVRGLGRASVLSAEDNDDIMSVSSVGGTGRRSLRHRYTLAELLLSALAPSTSAPGNSPQRLTIALKLLNTLAAKHPVWSIDKSLLDGEAKADVQWGAADATIVATDDDEESFVYPGSSSVAPDELEDDEEAFVYPGATESTPVRTSTTSTPPAKAATGGAVQTPLPLPFTSRGAFTPRTPTIAQHAAAEKVLTPLVGVSAKTKTPYAVWTAAGGSDSTTGGVEGYLNDAEKRVVQDLSFRRELAVVSTSTAPGQQRMPRHRLDSRRSPVLRALLLNLARFFENSPEMNLNLTEVITTLAVCPARDLEGWLMARKALGFLDTLAAASGSRDGDLTTTSNDGDDRSEDDEFESRFRSPAGGGTNGEDYALSSKGASTVFGVIASLTRAIEHYRAEIPNFGTYLDERRQGLMFSDNLAEALGDDIIGFTRQLNGSFTAAVARQEAKQQEVEVKKPVARGFGAFFTGSRPATPTSRPASPAPRTASVSSFGTPVASSSTTPASLDVPAAEAGGKGSASPFAKHYKQTGSIKVPHAPEMELFEESSEDEEDEGNSSVRDNAGWDQVADTPTKRLSHFVPSGRTQPMRFDTAERKATPKKEKDQGEPLTLSMLLDNVVILEEWAKELLAVLHVRRSFGIDSVALF